MMEQLKTVLLLCLIGLSLFLTYQLWYGQKPAELVAEDVYEQVELETPRSLEETVVPYRIVLNGGNTNYLYSKGNPGFDELWQELSDLLKNIENNFFSEDQNGPEEEGLRCLACYFDPALPAGDENLWLPGLSTGSIEILSLYCLQDSYWLVIKKADQEEKQYLLLDEAKAAQFSAILENLDLENETAYSLLTVDLINEIMQDDPVEDDPIENDPVEDDPTEENTNEGNLLEKEIDIRASIYVPLGEVFMEKFNVEPENLEKELLLKTFFVDYNLVREIEERDGSLLYTDGEKGLRLSNNRFEYSYPRLEEGQTTVNYSEALRKSSSLISFHGGWPENLRLADLSLNSRAGLWFYVAEWTLYKNGYPFLTGQPTRASFNDQGLFHFTRSLYNPEAPVENFEEELPVSPHKITVEVAAWTDALLQAISNIEDTATDVGSRLRLGALELAYAVTTSEGQLRGIPVWFVIINGEEIILEADTLETINKEDLL